MTFEGDEKLYDDDNDIGDYGQLWYDRSAMTMANGDNEMTTALMILMFCCS